MADFNTPDEKGSLFTPSLQEKRGPSGPKPWKQNSQFWVAFFGGVLPYTLIAYINSIRLEMPKEKQRMILLVGAAGFIVLMMISFSMPITGLGETMTDSGRNLRLAKRIVAVVVYMACSALQKSADRIYQLATEGEEDYDSLWKLGLIAVFGIGTIESLISYGLPMLIGKG